MQSEDANYCFSTLYIFEIAKPLKLSCLQKALTILEGKLTTLFLIDKTIDKNLLVKLYKMRINISDWDEKQKFKSMWVKYFFKKVLLIHLIEFIF